MPRILTPEQITKSREVRSARSVAWTNDMLRIILACISARALPRTYEGIADYLNDVLGVTTSTGKPFDRKKVHNLFERLGIRSSETRERHRQLAMQKAEREGKDYRAELARKTERTIAANRARRAARGINPDAPRDLDREPWTPPDS